MTTFILPRWRRSELDQQQAKTMARIALETGATVTIHTRSSHVPGDPALLRGIPVVGVPGGFGGAIPGTRP